MPRYLWAGTRSIWRTIQSTYAEIIVVVFMCSREQHVLCFYLHSILISGQLSCSVIQWRRTVVQIERQRWGQYHTQQYQQHTSVGYSLFYRQVDIFDANSKEYRTQNRPLRDTFLNIKETRFSIISRYTLSSICQVVV